MKLACSTWMIPGETFDEKMKNAARYGFDGVEIRLFEKDYSPTIIKEIIRAGQGAGVNPCSLIMPGEIYRKPLLDRETLEAKVELSKKAIDAAAELGSPTIVFPEYDRTYQSIRDALFLYAGRWKARPGGSEGTESGAACRSVPHEYRGGRYPVCSAKIQC